MIQPGQCLGSDNTLGSGLSDRIQTHLTGMMTDIFTDVFQVLFRHHQTIQTPSDIQTHIRPIRLTRPSMQDVFVLSK